MSSISGLSPSVTTQTQDTTAVTGTTPTTPTTTLYLDLGLGNLTKDLTGLTKPRTPAETSAILGEILALAEDLSALAREQALRNQGSMRRGEFANIAELMTALVGTSVNVEKTNKEITELKEQRQVASDNADSEMRKYNEAVGAISYYDGVLSTQWNGYNDQYNAADRKVNSLQNELNDKNTSKERREAISNPGGLMSQAVAERSNAAYYRDVYTYSTANPTFQARANAVVARDTATQKYNEFKDSIKQIDEVDLPKAENTLAGHEQNFRDYTFSAVSLAAAMAVVQPGTKANTDSTDDVTDAFLDEFVDKLQAIARKAATVGEADWRGVNVVKKSDTDEGMPAMRVVSVVAGLLSAIRDVLDAILAISKLDTGKDPGLEETSSGRYHLAV